MELLTEAKLNCINLKKQDESVQVPTTQKSEENIKSLFGILPTDIDFEKELEKRMERSSL